MLTAWFLPQISRKVNTIDSRIEFQELKSRQHAAFQMLATPIKESLAIKDNRKWIFWRLVGCWLPIVYVINHCSKGICQCFQPATPKSILSIDLLANGRLATISLHYWTMFLPEWKAQRWNEKAQEERIYCNFGSEKVLALTLCLVFCKLLRKIFRISSSLSFDRAGKMRSTGNVFGLIFLQDEKDWFLPWLSLSSLLTLLVADQLWSTWMVIAWPLDTAWL